MNGTIAQEREGDERKEPLDQLTTKCPLDQIAGTAMVQSYLLEGVSSAPLD